uniref:Uncharacterized protein n=1 Tax=Picea glauca TaxID=3330 RepID=A0A101M364_PICGL|nr:hypothetical protein ABT39_MTgene3327 [Picea glauca]QHR88568.1 hypothetical protein Q903MT_gene2582 [Picea sitchensis]
MLVFGSTKLGLILYMELYIYPGEMKAKEMVFIHRHLKALALPLLMVVKLLLLPLFLLSL